MKTAYLIFFFIFIFTTEALTKTPKKTVCSITINSSEEIETFKKHFDSKIWNFVELTSVGQNQDYSSRHEWFEKACKKKISCDVLVISGHFGGRFFGSSSFELSMEGLERSSCSSDCSGIIDHPKEVFLFGCNTLAGKDRDRRSPEEYFNVLIADGYTELEARDIVSFRYGPTGASFARRMSDVFSKTPRIYGFNSIGPSGKNVEPLLDRYLKKTKNAYQNFDEMNRTLQTQINTNLMDSLKHTAIAQIAGGNVLGNTADLYKGSKPYCYLSNEKHNDSKKLTYVKEVLESDRFLTVLPYIKDYIFSLKNKEAELSQPARSVLKTIKQSVSIKQDLEKLYSLKGDTFLKVRIDSLLLLKEFNMISQDEHENKLLQALNLNFSSPLSESKVNEICSYRDLDFNIKQLSIPENQWKDKNLHRLVTCLKPKNPEILFRVFKESDIWDSEIVTIFEDMKALTPGVIAELEQLILKGHPDEEKLLKAAAILKANSFVSLNLQKKYFEYSRTLKGERARAAFVYYLGEPAIKDFSIVKGLFENLKNEDSEQVLEQIARTLSSNNTHNLEFYRLTLDYIPHVKSDVSRCILLNVFDSAQTPKDADIRLRYIRHIPYEPSATCVNNMLEAAIDWSNLDPDLLLDLMLEVKKQGMNLNSKVWRSHVERNLSFFDQRIEYLKSKLKK